ncbi:hypothetical protein NEOLEDRAFT_1140731 [Neolentinus lepideus HHB14362 ss-1]|uniref:Uncharacterized protein n=1 Tax=Neolentinus lepideus HHB14362 ss-1 TaxID=1314782 RepID=A0A165P2S5_9AGAM|nr:hypothetical protein NEOLEDRAFT_1140731 [Neolentinus lepideus HHB14362 ss-1]
MPTVPSVPVTPSSHSDIPSVPSPSASDRDAVAGPTPDPDTDDVLLAVTPCDPEGPAGRDSQPRRIPSLSNLVLHSPSSILGTPLDPTARFEYPFPSPSDGPSPSSSPDTDLPRYYYHYHSPVFPLLTAAVFALIPPALSRPRKRPKPRDPPVPPRLAGRSSQNTNISSGDEKQRRHSSPAAVGS